MANQAAAAAVLPLKGSRLDSHMDRRPGRVRYRSFSDGAGGRPLLHRISCSQGHECGHRHQHLALLFAGFGVADCLGLRVCQRLSRYRQCRATPETMSFAVARMAATLSPAAVTTPSAQATAIPLLRRQQPLPAPWRLRRRPPRRRRRRLRHPHRRQRTIHRGRRHRRRRFP